MIAQTIDVYINRFSETDKKINAAVNKNTGIIVVIPCYIEPDLIRSLQSLNNATPPPCRVEVITVINAAQNSTHEVKAQNSKTLLESEYWVKTHQKNFIDFYFINENNLPAKHAGVGLARKIGMDEAVRRFKEINCNGIITCFDADCTCSENYFTALYESYRKHNWYGCSIYFEHPLEGKEYSSDIYHAICLYELFLRYYRQMLKYCGLPFAYHTIGSAMAVSCEAYCKQGGMNKRKAGEDFYFLNKIIPLGNFFELNDCCVYPSPRTSNRVPFGTGKAVNDILNNKQQNTYNPLIFYQIKLFISQLNVLYQSGFEAINIQPEIKEYLLTCNITDALAEIKNNISNYESFQKRFFNWFDAFRVLKCVHYLRDNFFNDIPVKVASTMLLDKLSVNYNSYKEKDLLKLYRKLDSK
jgi:hypothetical protein